MLEKFQIEIPSLEDILSTIRLASVSQRLKGYLRLVNEEMRKAGMFASSREGTWLFLAEESLRPYGKEISKEQKSSLIDLFSILRRMYKSADDAWDQSQKIRKYLMDNPFLRVTKRLTWKNRGIVNVTHLSPLLKYLDARLVAYFPKDELKRNKIRLHYESFLKDSVFALIEFERLQSQKKPDWKECFNFYKKTTGRIGETIGAIVSEVVNTNREIKQKLQTNFTQAALVSQLVDDLRDIPLDLTDLRSPSVVKAMLSLTPNEYQDILDYAQKSGPHISYKIFKSLAFRTAVRVEILYSRCTNNLSRNLRWFLKDFYYALPPTAVSHRDSLNKEWHTSLKANQKLRDYIQRLYSKKISR